MFRSVSKSDTRITSYNVCYTKLLRLLHCMSILPEKWRAVFSLRVVDELDTETVCKELDITSSNLWVILHRAKLQLRECVERNWFTD